jgi:hypothetical protein
MPSDVNFIATTHQGVITVSRVKKIARDGDHSIDFSPAEAAKASQSVAIVLSMRELKTVPDHILNSPFAVRVFPKNVYALERTDQGGSLPFRAKEGDELIRIIDLGLGLCLNEQTHGRRVPVGTTVLPGLPDAESF